MIKYDYASVCSKNDLILRLEGVREKGEGRDGRRGRRCVEDMPANYEGRE